MRACRAKRRADGAMLAVHYYRCNIKQRRIESRRPPSRRRTLPRATRPTRDRRTMFSISRALNLDGSDLPLVDDESTLAVVRDVAMTVGSGRESTSSSSSRAVVGTLAVTTRRFFFASPSIAYECDVRNLSLHALSAADETYPDGCVYCQIAGGVEGSTKNPFDDDDDDETRADAEDEDDDDFDDEDGVTAQVRFIPTNRTTEEIQSAKTRAYDAMSEAAALNPDTDEDDDEDDDDAYYDEEEMDERAAALDAKLMISDDVAALALNDPDRFADADD
jgi:hypothetical protein